MATTHALQCMEIWGGNAAFDSAVAVPGIDLWVTSVPHAGDNHGGDLHYVSTCGSGRIARFAVADVSGHGSSAARLGDRLRGLMRKYINELDQTRFIRALNREFLGLSEGVRFATALLVSYFAPTDHLVVCNAGHPSPLWYRRAEGAWSVLRHDMPDTADRIRNLPLGIVAPTSYYQFAVRLEPGDLVLLYTDWLIEAAGPDGKLLGEVGVLRLLNGLDASDPATLNRRLMEAVARFRGGTPPDDDVTLVLLHHNAAEAPRMTAANLIRVLGKMAGLVPVERT